MSINYSFFNKIPLYYANSLGLTKQVIFDEEDYELRKVKVCKACGEEMHNHDKCPLCGDKNYEYVTLEKEVLGMYVTGHPLSQYKEVLERNTSIDNGKLNSLKEDEESYLSLDERDVIMGGMIANKVIKTTKRNDIMAFLDLEDLYGNIEVIVFPQTLKKYNEIVIVKSDGTKKILWEKER